MEKKFGAWTFIQEKKNKHGKTDYECECKCGVIKLVDRKNLLTGRSTRCRDCGIRDRSLIDYMIGKTFGEYLIIDKCTTKNKDTHYTCRCSCGNIRIVRGTDLRKGNSRRCHICARKTYDYHGFSQTATYKIWKGIRQRCYNPNNPSYSYYGGRGIRMQDSWKDSFLEFYKDVGEKLPGMELDRIDNDGNYEAMNCRWVSKADNMRNTRRSKKNRHRFIIIDKNKLCAECLTKI